jgi:hypothetical protein
MLAVEPPLQVKVNFECKRRSLSDLLRDLQQKTGVIIVTDTEAPVDTLQVTAYIKDMPLGELMCNLSRLFGVTWTKTQDRFCVHGSHEPEVEKLLRRLGDFGQVSYKASLVNEQQENALAAEIFPHTDSNALHSKAGFPIANLPEDLQVKLRHQVRQRLALSIVRAQQKACSAYLEDCILSVKPETGGTVTDQGKQRDVGPRLMVSILTRLQDEITTLPFQLSPPPAPNSAISQAPAKSK